MSRNMKTSLTGTLLGWGALCVSIGGAGSARIELNQPSEVRDLRTEYYTAKTTLENLGNVKDVFSLGSTYQTHEQYFNELSERPEVQDALTTEYDSQEFMRSWGLIGGAPSLAALLGMTVVMAWVSSPASDSKP